ncbi:MAG: hypothetical protein HC800_18880 [Phormidesmis sp. RL_2_1]|nr:hypothetical protein [Phormidesmis sp. RL_2_1]
MRSAKHFRQHSSGKDDVYQCSIEQTLKTCFTQNLLHSRIKVAGIREMAKRRAWLGPHCAARAVRTGGEASLNSDGRVPIYFCRLDSV